MEKLYQIFARLINGFYLMVIELILTFKFKDFIGCLPNYPHAFGIGTKCCSAENNGFNNTCAEKQLLYTSDCCRGKSIDCPNKNGKCLNMGENSFLQIIFLNFII